FLILPGQQGDVTIPSRLHDQSSAACAHFALRPTDRLTVSAGARYTRHGRAVAFAHAGGTLALAALGNRVQSRRDSQLTWRPAGRYRLADDLNIYASVARGFKPGGFDLTRLPNFANFEFDSETNTTFEIGLKGSLLDRRLRF